MTMKARDLMSRDVTVANPDDTIQQAAMLMGRIDSGVLPVCEEDRLVGMITDRDLAIRGVAEGRNPAGTKVREIMTTEAKYCFEDEAVSHVSENMAAIRVRRLPVVDREKRLVGLLSLGDIAGDQDPDKTGEALRGISQPGGPHSQTA